MFERLGSSLRNSKKMFNDNFLFGFLLFTFIYTVQFITNSNFGTFLFSIMTIYLIVDQIYNKDKFEKTLVGFLKLLGFSFLLGIVYSFVVMIPLVGLIFSQSGGIIQLFFILLFFISVLFIIISSIALFFVPYYIVDGFSIIESVKYSWKSVHSYGLYLEVIGAMLFFTILTFITITFVVLIGSLNALMISNTILLLLIFGLMVGSITGLISFRITTWTIQYGLSLYKEVNDIAL